jgi:hypothetical protein
LRVQCLTAPIDGSKCALFRIPTPPDHRAGGSAFLPSQQHCLFFSDEQNNFWSKHVRRNDARLDPDLINKPNTNTEELK